MAIVFHAILARKHGASEGYAVVASFGALASVHAKYTEIVDGAKGADFRAKHAEVHYIRDGVLFSQHSFPDPVREAELKKKQALDEAKRVRDGLTAADAATKAASEKLQAARAAVRQLTPEQKALLAEEDERLAKQQAAIEAQKKEAEQKAAAAKAEADKAAKAAADAAQAEAAAAAAAAGMLNTPEQPAQPPADPAPPQPPVDQTPATQPNLV